MSNSFAHDLKIRFMSTHVYRLNKAAQKEVKLTRKSNHAEFKKTFRERKYAEKVEVNCKKRENQAKQLGNVFTRPCDRLVDGVGPCNKNEDVDAVCKNTWDCESIVCKCSDGFSGEDCS